MTAERKRVLVTGGTGFIGVETLPFLLERGYEVHVLGRNAIQSSADLPAAKLLHVHQFDLLRQDCHALLAEIRPTHLLHLAWYAEHGAFWWALENLDWVAASLRLVRAFAAAGGTRAVFAGTCAEYDWSTDTLDETATPLRPATLYGVAKLSLFQLLQSARDRLGIATAWGRIFFPYGPRDQPGKLLCAVIDGVHAGKAVACSDGRQIRSFIYVEDVASAFVDLLDSEVSGAVNIATDEVSSVRDMVAHAARLSGDESLVQFGARPMQKGEPPLLRAVTRRLYDEVGFRPRFSLKDGVARTVQVRAAKRAG
jgi:nucleoside-diphosphate-sugar epimerase